MSERDIEELKRILSEQSREFGTRLTLQSQEFGTRLTAVETELRLTRDKQQRQASWAQILSAITATGALLVSVVVAVAALT